MTQQDPSQPALSPAEEMESFDPVIVWRRSPLDADAIEAVLAAARVPVAVPAEQRQALILTLAKLADWLAAHWLQRRPSKQSDIDRAAHAFKDFIVALGPLGATSRQPPWPSTEWVDQFVAWIRREAGKPAQLGRPEKAAEAVICAELLDFFALAFRRAPASTFEGPTMRFVSAFHSAMQRGRLELGWQPPAREAQRSAIRAAIAGGSRLKLAPIFFAAFRNMAERPRQEADFLH